MHAAVSQFSSVTGLLSHAAVNMHMLAYTLACAQRLLWLGSRVVQGIVLRTAITCDSAAWPDSAQSMHLAQLTTWNSHNSTCEPYHSCTRFLVC